MRYVQRRNPLEESYFSRFVALFVFYNFQLIFLINNELFTLQILRFLELIFEIFNDKIAKKTKEFYLHYFFSSWCLILDYEF
ncbi:Uncharacterised protein [Candidatus Bartonella washoeensis]|uniref:Uncharacterized protein n=1 Tax=Candidatus Bartonella washoeensis Sb944nv TaxID=1094563 RepID=J0Q8C1_9HYPH|nr:hypothetical protein MCQ_00194 [Bartonella washoeensis Sb944nv]SPU28053.1 Uncharacterised protein [Bartonella washoeensis]